MKRTTIGLSGAAKDRLLRDFFREEIGSDMALADRLARESSTLFVSVRVRRTQLGLRRRPQPAPPVQQEAPTGPPFDPYVFGLVPVFQREGRDGLLTRLATVADAGDLQLMARSQQIVLPVHLRSGPAEHDELCAAIADAVARRIADRRAAAG
jgi:hypothetical protein